MINVNIPLEARNIVAGYGKTLILQGIDLTVKGAEIVCIAGPNGSGKSTLLKVVSGLLPFTEGSLSIFGQHAASGHPGDAARSDVGYVPQVQNVFPTLSVRENIRLASRHSSRKLLAEAEERAFELFPKLRAIRNRRAADLSGGERQAVAFAMALTRSPKLLLLDEPSAALAPNLVEEVFQQIAELRDLGIAVLLVEQNVRAALEIADRVYFLQSGQNAMDGTAEEMKADPRIQKVYLGSI